METYMKTKESCKEQNKKMEICYFRNCSNDQFYRCYPEDGMSIAEAIIKSRV